MKTITPKWHYYNHKDEICMFEHPFTEGFVQFTYCGRNAREVIAHTEFKDRVTCLNCLRRINCLTKGENYAT